MLFRRRQPAELIGVNADRASRAAVSRGFARLEVMFDLRYHVASLAAVFLALAIGILLGIGVADRGLIDRGREELLEDRVAELQRSLDQANARIAAIESREVEGNEFVDAAYPTVVADRLVGTRVALVFVGGVDDEIRAAVEDALQDAGAPPLLRLRALRVPLDEDAVRTRYGGAIDELGRSLGSEFIRGETTPIWDRLSGVIVEERAGAMSLAADAVVVARSAEPQTGDTARFLRGFYEGLAAGDVPAVGVDFSTADTSPIETFRRANLSTVDNLETPTGRLALVVLLAGGRPGNYGVAEDSDDGVLPPLPPPPPLPAG